jgi:flagellar basal-body rod protein FlgB
MITAMFNQPGYQGVKAMMDMTAARQQAIASNISNLNTPNYKRIDVAPTFESELKSAISSRDLDSIRGLRPTLAVDHNASAADSKGNTVQLEDELLKMSANTMAHQLEAKVISGAMAKMKMAITGHGR